MAMTQIEVAEKSSRILERLLKLEEYRQADTIMVYLSVRNEVSTVELIKRAMSQGKRVAAPVTDIINRRLTPSVLSDYPGDLHPGPWNIPEPKPGCLRPVGTEELDLVIVPGVAFDEKGNRLGYGGGFYDRFLKGAGPGAVCVALAFEQQVRRDVYPEPHDFPVSLIVTEERLIRSKN